MVLDWSDMKELPWGVLLLFGGGLSMAAGLQITECGQIISANAGVLAGLPRWAILIGVSLLVMLASNFTSNTALAATLIGLTVLILWSPNLQSYGIVMQPTVDFLTSYIGFVLLGMIFLGALVGTISSLLATRRYLKI